MARKRRPQRRPDEILSVAIYARKSTQEAPDQEFGSTEAQRQAGEKFVESQAGKGWRLDAEEFADIGFSGATLERPAFQRLLDRVRAGEIQVVVVYRIDRLCRSLLGFAEILSIFEEYDVAFVSVTESFSTADSTGKLLLNILMSFAAYERDTIAERTRDKMAATRKLGRWTGGVPVLGYIVVEKRLVVDDAEASLVRDIFRMFLHLGSITKVVEKLNDLGMVTKRQRSRSGRERGGKAFTKTYLRKILTNPMYLGVVDFDGEYHDGQHDAIVDQGTWDEVQSRIKKSPKRRPRSSRVSPLAGLLRCARCECGYTPTYTTKKGVQYRYYECDNRRQRGASMCPKGRVPAQTIEAAVVEQLRVIGRHPSVVEKAVAVADGRADLQELREDLAQLEPLWEVLTVEERAEAFQILIERIVFDPDGGQVDLDLQSHVAPLFKDGAA